jgi:hypothetical protein
VYAIGSRRHRIRDLHREVTMSNTTLLDAVEIYDCCKNTHLLGHRVRHQDLMEFCFALNRFVATLGYLAWDDFWKPFVKCLKKYSGDKGFCSKVYEQNSRQI